MSEPSREACFGGVVNRICMDCGWLYANSLLVWYVCVWWLRAVQWRYALLCERRCGR